MSIYEWFQQIFATNNFWLWAVIAVLAAIATLIVKLLFRAASSRLRLISEKTASIWDDVLLDILDGLNPVVIFIWFVFLLTKTFSPSDFAHKTMLVAVVVVTIFQIGIWGHHLIRSWRNTVLNKKIEQDPSSAAAIGLLYTTIQTIFIAIIILIGLSNLGVDIGALLAGLGVGGIAVALAAQNILGDLLASLSIVLDKPFVVGDFIVAGADKGTVVQIGIKTTRLLSLSGEELILSNKDILESRIHNYKRMERRRVVLNFGVVYSTPVEILELIPSWVKPFIEQNKKLQFDRVHFAELGAFSLNFELVYFVLDPDYILFMDSQQKVLLDIFRKFTQEGVDFAFPTQSLHVEKLPNRTDLEKLQLSQ